MQRQGTVTFAYARIGCATGTRSPPTVPTSSPGGNQSPGPTSSPGGNQPPGPCDSPSTDSFSASSRAGGDSEIEMTVTSREGDSRGQGNDRRGSSAENRAHRLEGAIKIV